MVFKRIVGIFLTILIIFNFMVTPLVEASTKTKEIHEYLTIPVTAYGSYEIQLDESADSTRVYLRWESNQDIDVWLLDDNAFLGYKFGYSFSALYHAYGTTGIIDVTLKRDQYSYRSFLVIFDNTDASDVKPTSDTIDDTTNVTVTIDGELTANYEDDNYGGFYTYFSCYIIGGIAIFIIITIYKYFNKKKKQSQIYPSQQPLPQYQEPEPKDEEINNVRTPKKVQKVKKESLKGFEIKYQEDE